MGVFVCVFLLCTHVCVYLPSFSLCVVVVLVVVSGWGGVSTDPLDPLHALMGVHLVWIPAKRFQHCAVGN